MATLADLILQVRQRADMVNSTFVDDTTEVIPWINDSYSELYDLLVSRFEDYFSERVPFTLSGANSYPLPSNFYKVRALDIDLGGGRYGNVDKFNFENRNASYSDASLSANFVLWQIPRFKPLVNLSDVLGDVMDFKEFIVIDSAMKCLDKEESDTGVLAGRKAKLEQRILAMASNRDVRPERITDVTHSWSYGPKYSYRVMGQNIMIVRSDGYGCEFGGGYGSW